MSDTMEEKHIKLGSNILDGTESLPNVFYLVLLRSMIELADEMYHALNVKIDITERHLRDAYTLSLRFDFSSEYLSINDIADLAVEILDVGWCYVCDKAIYPAVNYESIEDLLCEKCTTMAEQDEQ